MTLIFSSVAVWVSIFFFLEDHEKMQKTVNILGLDREERGSLFKC